MTNFFSKNKQNQIIENEEGKEESINSNFENNENGLEENAFDVNSSEEGQLSVDIYQTKDQVIIKSTIAGVNPEDIDISIDGDTVTIRGSRKQEENIKEEDYFYQECYWGSFSRSIVLPVEVKSDDTQATLKNGVLTIILPKVKKNKSIAVKVKGE